MSEDDKGLEPNENDGNEGNEAPPELTLEDYKALVPALRRENAKHRTEKQALKADADAYQALKLEQMSELEKAQAKAAALEERLKRSEKGEAQRKAAKAAELDPDLAERIQGESEDEMLEDAKRLQELLGSRKKDDRLGPEDLFGGPQNKKPVGAVNSSADWWKSFSND